MRCPADLLHHFLVVAAVALVRRRATAVAVPRGFDVVAVEGTAAGGDPREEDEEGHDVDVPEPLEAQEDGTELEERVTTELVQEYPQVNLITLFINSPLSVFSPVEGEVEGDGVEVELLVPVEGERGGRPEHEAARRRHGGGEAVEQHELQPPGAVVVQRGGRRGAGEGLLVGTPERGADCTFFEYLKN